VSTVQIDKRTGKLPYAEDTEVMDEIFLAGTEPTDIATPPPPDAGVDEGGLPDAGSPDATTVVEPPRSEL
jgi:penicillin-binding protein 1A